MFPSTLRPMRSLHWLLIHFSALLWLVPSLHADHAELHGEFRSKVLPMVSKYCLECHGDTVQESELNLRRFSEMSDIAEQYELWQLLVRRVAAGEMPPPEHDLQPSAAERQMLSRWSSAFRSFEAKRTDGDPGPVPVRRLNQSEYNYLIHDLTGVDIAPTKTFPIDPANESGFDNSALSLSMSPALLDKYLAAARMVSEHLVLGETGIDFATHPVMTSTDRDKYCVNRIVEFYRSMPTDLAAYFAVAHRARATAGDQSAVASEATAANLSARYAKRIWNVLVVKEQFGPIAKLQEMFDTIPSDASDAQVKSKCVAMRDYVVSLRQQLSPRQSDLYVEGSHKGSQAFVLWKNDRYAASRYTLATDALKTEGTPGAEEVDDSLVLSQDEPTRSQQLKALERFCEVFPDAFYISERGRDYLDKPRDEQEKGRLLSAGFHSMMGYYRDDDPLQQWILSDAQKETLDRLWRELNMITSAPKRQYSGFLWFERTDSRYMRDPIFDFARPENKDASSEEMIKRLGKLYHQKAKDSGGSADALKAIEVYFQKINYQIRQAENWSARSEPAQIEGLLDFARRAWRGYMTDAHRAGLLKYYGSLRTANELDHDTACRELLVAILMSPKYLYRVDLMADTDPRALSGPEVANRLSFFLWSAAPDEQLLQAVSDNPLATPNEIADQVERMLKDRRVERFVVQFATNWLGIRQFQQHNAVDRKRFPQFTDSLRQSMFEEPVRYIADLIQNDASILQLLDSDHTLVNADLAAHYGIDEVEFSSDPWQRVPMARRYGRGGLLPMSVFLTANSPGLRTSPVKRGYWIVRNLLGEHIPPPPPDVPELPNEESAFKELSLREMLARHRDHASCAGCHQKFDSLGLAFEAYGPIGGRRATDLSGKAVDTSAVFPGGHEGDGLEGLRSYLMAHRKDEFVENVSRKLLAYALGRNLQLSDEPLIQRMQKDLADSGYRFTELVRGIVTSKQFLTKRGQK